MAAVAGYWQKELDSFRQLRSSRPEADYRDWRPTKWQGLQGVASRALAEAETRGAPIGTAVELGCGSAALLLQLALAGRSGTGVDEVEGALVLAAEAAASLGVDDRVSFLHGDFLDEGFAEQLDRADLVLSAGVIEHWEHAGQLEVLAAHTRLARSWVLLAVPNLESPVFRSFEQWAKRSDGSYGVEHRDISIPALAQEAGCAVVYEDGFHLFLGRGEYYAEGDPELDGFHREARERLVAAGGSRYAAFPRVDFERSDIAALSRVELEVPRETRLRYGFMRYYLLDVR
jgi:2-polyprenyl-3-methyl-5-hydroxy-6-metoxy-1,4-benzoquinol methylase